MFLVFCIQPAFSQDYLADIGTALRRGNVKAMSKYFDANIEISINEKSKVYTKDQAIKIVQQFFSKIEPKDYIGQQFGKSTGSKTKFHIGTLITSNGTYKVYLFFIRKSNEYFLKELRFEK